MKKEEITFIVEDQELQNYREEYSIPAFCKFCRNLMENWDSQFWFKYGTCSNCFIDYLADRPLPDGLLQNKKEIAKFINEELKKKTK